jgi:pantetheine-phosphate adenylyltransferase
MKKAVYAGSFDPVTVGHMWMIEEAARIFDHVTVAVGQNPDKRYMFTAGERCEMIQHAVRESGLTHAVSVEILSNNFLVDFAKRNDIEFMVRGLREVSDFDFERRLRNINSRIDPNISTIFLMPPAHLMDVSSSMVKGMMGPEGWEEIVNRYVPNLTAQKLRIRMRGGRSQ